MPCNRLKILHLGNVTLVNFQAKGREIFALISWHYQKFYKLDAVLYTQNLKETFWSANDSATGMLDCQGQPIRGTNKLPLKQDIPSSMTGET